MGVQNIGLNNGILMAGRQVGKANSALVGGCTRGQRRMLTTTLTLQTRLHTSGRYVNGDDERGLGSFRDFAHQSTSFYV